ncbi:unnamed protein product [Prorocentrum cordatum]|uniref:NADAR domain-containing protein n=1 Tax=Prorocentrum cordatum TaxID=2364126 RepID=A0ABN9VSN9_9DINO|nr:unnamed protein product [Polarella glacialis]
MGGPCKILGDDGGISDAPACTDNFFVRPYRLNGAQWQSAEQFFQAFKYQDQEMVQKFQESVPEEGTSSWAYGCFMARMGQERHPSFRNNWEQIKAEVMYRAKRAQIAQHPDLKEELISTGGHVLIHEDGNAFWSEWNGKCMARIRDEVMPDGRHPEGDQKRDSDLEALVVEYAKVIENEAFFADCPELMHAECLGRWVQRRGAAPLPDRCCRCPSAPSGQAPAASCADPEAPALDGCGGSRVFEADMISTPSPEPP